MSYDLFFYKFGFKIFPRGISSFFKILNNVVNYKDLLRELHKTRKHPALTLKTILTKNCIFIYFYSVLIIKALYKN